MGLLDGHTPVGSVWVQDETRRRGIFSFSTSWKTVPLVLGTDTLTAASASEAYDPHGRELARMGRAEDMHVALAGIGGREVVLRDAYLGPLTHDRHQIILQVCNVDGVRRSMLYHTAAKLFTMSIYAETETECDTMLTAIQDTITEVTGIAYPPITRANWSSTVCAPEPTYATHAGTMNSDPSYTACTDAVVPPATLDVRGSTPMPSNTQQPPAPPSNSVRSQLDAAFDALARAQELAACAQQATARAWFQHAGHIFADVEPRLPDERSRQLVRRERISLAETIARLASSSSASDVIDENATASTLEHALSELPPIPLEAPSADNSSSASITSTSSSTSPRLVERLGQLRMFEDKRDVQRAQQERSTTVDALTLRLRALRSNTGQAATPSSETLQSRLERLRGNSGDVVGLESELRASRTSAGSPSRGSAVDRIIQQAMDEVALGIEDADFEDDEEQGDASADESTDSDSESGEENEGAKPSKKRATKRSNKRTN